MAGAGRGKRGQGSIYHRTSDGLWCASLAIKGKRHTAYAETKEQAERLLNRMRYERDTGTFVAGSSQTVAQFLTSWFEGVVMQSELSYNSAENVRIQVAHLTRELGAYRLSDLSPDLIQRAYGALRKDRAASTVHNIHVTLKNALNYAVECRHLSWNPASAARATASRTHEMAVLSPAELRLLFSSTEGTRWHALWIVLGATGIRSAEARGLKWTDFDFTKRTMTIERQLEYRCGAGFWFVPPKTKESKRTISLPAAVVTALRAHDALQKREKLAAQTWHEKGLVFCGENGLPLYRDRLNRQLDVALDAAGLPRIRVHDLRHTCATILLRNGANLKQVSEMLGHASAEITLGVYAHVVPGMHEEAARLMDALLTEEESPHKEGDGEGHATRSATEEAADAG